MEYTPEASEEEKLKYALEFSKLTPKEKSDSKRERIKDLQEEGFTVTEAVYQVDAEEKLMYEYLKEAKAREKMEKKSEEEKTWHPKEETPHIKPKGFSKEELKHFKPDMSKVESEEEMEEEIAAEKPSKPRFLDLRQKLAEGVEKFEEYGKEALGFEERNPLKAAIISGASKVITSLKSKETPKTTTEKRRKMELEEAARESKLRDIRRGIKKSSEEIEREPREPSLKDIGKGSMGAERYEPFQPDFFGGGNYDIGVKTPMGEPAKRKENRPPSTHIPFGGKRAPETYIPSGGSRPPSTSFPGRVGLPDTRVSFRERAPSTKVPTIRERPPKVGFRGAKKVSTRVPEGKKKAPVILKKAGKPISTRIGKPSRIKTQVPKQEDEDILGLKNFW